jgi:hypothetical protein
VTKQFYPSYKAALLDNGVDLISGNVKVCALSSTYVFSSAHDFHDDLSGIIATSGNLATKTGVAGVFDSANISLGSPAGGSTITQIVLWRDSGTSATSELVYHFDEDSAGNPLSIATDGTEKTISVNASGWFRV